MTYQQAQREKQCAAMRRKFLNRVVWTAFDRRKNSVKWQHRFYMLGYGCTWARLCERTIS